MPELPEVENVKRSLEALGPVGRSFKGVDLRAKSLRTPLRGHLSRRLPGQRILGIQRRAKFLLFETDDYFIVNHLGMTGSWRPQGKTEEFLKHDHVRFRLDSGLNLVFNDPRRFGLMELVAKKKLGAHAWLKALGPEPLSDSFNGAYLFSATRGHRVNIKNFIMDQKKVVGVGNIYASEALYKAGVRPARMSSRLSRREADKLASAIKNILGEAIQKGGSTIRDYKNTNGESGRFQNEFFVYGRSSEPCRHCNKPIRSRMFGGRNTYWCSTCQS